MAYLKTLEGTAKKGVDVYDLFNVNDTLGCMIYGPTAWNQIKSYACNRALELLASKNDFEANLHKLAGSKNYVVTNDILERAFGFNHNLGCELYGVDEWREFVLDCKTYTPPAAYMAEEMGSVKGAITSMLKPAGLLYPENLTPGGVIQWLLNPGATNAADAAAALGNKPESLKKAEAKADSYRQAAEAAEAHSADVEAAAIQAVAQAREQYSREYAEAKAKEDATAAANADLQYRLKTDPDYMANQTKNYMLVGGAILLAAAIFMRK